MTTPNANAALTKLQDWPYRFEVVPLDQMYIDKYQRPLSSFVRIILADFDPSLLGTLTLSERPKRGKLYSVIDGQTRAEAMRQRGLESAPCVIFYELTIEQEAELFSKFQRQRRSITPMQRFNADLIAKDARAIGLNRLVESLGFKITDQAHDYQLKAVVALEKIYEENPERLRTTLRLIRETWGTMPYATHERMLKGVTQFLIDLEKGGSEVDEARFSERLSALTPSEVERRARLLRDGAGISTGVGVRFVVEVIQQGYRTSPRKR